MSGDDTLPDHDRSGTDDTGGAEGIERFNESGALERVRRLGWLLDDSIPLPGTNRRFGLDPLVGLLPIAGDLSTGVLSVYIVTEAVAVGVSRATLVRMLLNVAIDVVVGSIPVLGALFDFAWKANERNVSLLEARAEHPEGARADRRFLLVALAVFVLGLTGVAFATVLLVQWVLAHFGIP